MKAIDGAEQSRRGSMEAICGLLAINQLLADRGSHPPVDLSGESMGHTKPQTLISPVGERYGSIWR